MPTKYRNGITMVMEVALFWFARKLRWRLRTPSQRFLLHPGEKNKEFGAKSTSILFTIKLQRIIDTSYWISLARIRAHRGQRFISPTHCTAHLPNNLKSFWSLKQTPCTACSGVIAGACQHAYWSMVFKMGSSDSSLEQYYSRLNANRLKNAT